MNDLAAVRTREIEIPPLVQFTGDDERSNLLAVIRQLVESFRADRGLTQAAFVEMLGVPRRSGTFNSTVKAMSRFEKSEAKSPGSTLYPRLLKLFQNDLPGLDILDPDLYPDEVVECGHYHNSHRKFHGIRDTRFFELAEQLSTRYLIYKKPVNPHFKGMILRSYARFHPHKSGAMVALEYQKIVLHHKDTGTTNDTDFYIGICTRKDGVLAIMMRQMHNGAIKHFFFTHIALDSTSQMITGAMGYVVETCDAFTDGRLAVSGCAISCIPDSYTLDQIDALNNMVPASDVDDVIAAHVLRDHPV